MGKLSEQASIEHVAQWAIKRGEMLALGDPIEVGGRYGDQDWVRAYVLARHLTDLLTVEEAAQAFNVGERVPGILESPDEEIVGIEITVGELRKLRAALAALKGERA